MRFLRKPNLIMLVLCILFGVTAFDKLRDLGAEEEMLPTVEVGALPVHAIVAWDPFVRDTEGRPLRDADTNAPVTFVLPVGWEVCDGRNGTPDLRERFMYGARDVHQYSDVWWADSPMIPEGANPWADGARFTGIGGASQHAHDILHAHIAETRPFGPPHKGYNKHGNYGVNDEGHTHPVIVHPQVEEDRYSKDQSNLPPYVKIVYIIKVR